MRMKLQYQTFKKNARTTTLHKWKEKWITPLEDLLNQNLDHMKQPPYGKLYIDRSNEQPKQIVVSNRIYALAATENAQEI